MPDTIHNHEAEHEDAEPQFSCENCGNAVDSEDELTMIVVDRMSGGHWRTEQWCEDCCTDTCCVADSSEAWRPLPTDLVTDSVAQTFFHWHEDSCEWRTYPPEDEDEDEDGDSLLDYGRDVLDVLGWPRESRRTDLLFGVELEMEGRGSYYARDLVSLLGGSRGTRRGCAILKRDGSLDDGRGVELVTLPYTLEHHQKSGLWQDLLNARLQAAAKSGAGTTNCGIHVHINRRALSALTTGKLVVFLNNPDNATFCTDVAQRRSGGYCQRDERKKITSAYAGRTRLGTRIVETWSGERVETEDYIENSRYDIINVTGSRTVEVRMFRGNLRPERVLKNIEFCHALVRFCESASIRDSARFGNFLEWLGKNRRSYPHLLSFLTEKGWLAPRIVRGEPVPAPALSEA